MIVCSRCVLDENFPGIRFDSKGLCQYCIKHDNGPDSGVNRKRFHQKFSEVLGKVKDKATYDVLMAFSGGKDSSYTLKILKDDFGLKVTAILFDHGFVSPRAIENISTICGNLEVDLLTIAPGRSLLKRAFSGSLQEGIYPMKALERASSICNTCMHVAKSLFVRFAIEAGIPMIAYGWSPGQAPVQSSVMKLNASMVRQTQKMMRQSLERVMGKDIRSFLLQERHYRMMEEHDRVFEGSFLYNIHPLAFMDYNEDRIINVISELGWVAPSDTDANSTNCLLNSYANLAHIRKHGFHPYAFEVAGLVRDGLMSRVAGLKKLTEDPDDRIVREVEFRLGQHL